MGVRRDLNKARQRTDPAGRVKVDVVRDAHGVVREARMPALAPPMTSGSVADIPYANATEAPDATVLRREAHGTWHPVTAAAFAHEVTTTAKGLTAAGLEPGGRVAVMSRTRYEWMVLDFAIWAAGGQSVPIHATSSPERIEWIVRDSGARFMVVETQENAAAVATAAACHSQPPHVWQLTPTSAAAAAGGALTQLADLGRSIPEEEVTKRRAALTPDTAATICYTSGTTGRPRGRVLTHANLQAEAANLVELLHPVFKAVSGQADSTSLFLPLAHILGRTIQIGCLPARIELGHCPSIKPDELRPALKKFRPTFLIGVPYVFERVHATGRATAERIVVGDRPFVAALITLDPEDITHWPHVRGMSPDTPLSELVDDPRTHADVQKAVDYANQAVSRTESIRAFKLVRGEFNEDNGLLTPSLKIRRHAVTAAYAHEVEALYRG